MTLKALLSISCVAVVASLTAAASADPIAEFYRGKTITFIVSTGAGGPYDINARAIANHIGRHIPGEPTVIVQNMPGAGHVRAANFMHGRAAKDGTFVGVGVPTYILHQAMGGDGVHFDASEFNWLGSSAASNLIVLSWRETGIHTIEDAKQKELIMGGTGIASGTVLYPHIMNQLIGTRFRIVPGYNTGPEIDLAIERGEVEGRAGVDYYGVKATQPHWFAENKISLLAQIGLEKDPEIEDVPLMHEFGRTEEDRRILRLFSAVVPLHYSYYTTPGVPAERVEALRRAFDATMKDPAFLDVASKTHVIRPRPGEDVARIVAEILEAPPAVLERAKALQQR